MPLISQTLDNLLNGVSQQPPRLQLPSQSEAETNTIASKGEGLRKRPPTRHVALLSATPSAATVIPINVSEDERYLAVVTASAVQVFDGETGASLNVLTPDGLGYLTGTGVTWRSVTIQDTTVLINKTQVPGKGTTSAPVRNPEALVYIRQADYGTTYTVTIDGDDHSYATAESGRTLISTDYIATQIVTLLVAAFANFTFTRYGSTIHVKRTDLGAFTISTKDGLADAGLVVIKNKVQRFSDLPAIAVDGFVVEITGDPGTDADNYWVQYNDADITDQAGIWVETVRPGRLTAFAPSTMPHVLVKNGSVVPEFAAGHTPEPPVVQPFGAGGLKQVGFEAGFYDEDIDGAGVGNNNTIIKSDNAVGYANLKAATGLSTKFTVNYLVTTEAMVSTNALTVTVRYNVTQGATVWTTAASRRYVGNHYDQADSLTFTAPILVDRDISVLITYDTAPLFTGIFDQRGQVTLLGEDNAPGAVGVEFTPATDVDVVFDAAEMFPVGYVAAVTVDGVLCSYTVPETAGAITGAALATALEPAIEAVVNIASVVTGGSTIRITRTTSGVATVTLTTAAPNLVAYAWREVGALTVDAHVGMTIKNVTDGSSGVITDNGTDWIQVAALTGGSTNLFNPEDTLRIIDTPNLPYFVFRAETWTDRLVGDDDSNPFPSFTDHALDEVFFHEGRLGFTSGPNVILSAADDLFGFFRTTVTALRDSDPVDVTSTSATVQTFHAALSWDAKLILWAEQGQFVLVGSPLSPRTASLPQVSRYESTAACRPTLIGKGLFFPSKRLGFSQMSEMRATDDGLHAQAFPVTAELPRYLRGSVVQVAGSANAGVVLVLTDADPSLVYVYCFADTNEGRILGGWRQWQFPAGSAVRGVTTFGNQVALVVAHSDGLYLETLDLQSQEEGVLDTLVHMDRLLHDWAGANPVTAAGATTFDLPYSLATNGSAGTLTVVNATTGAAILATRPTATTFRITGTWTADQVYVGVVYSFLYRLSRIYFRNAQGVQNSGRLDLRWVNIITNRTQSYTLRVAQVDRADVTYAYAGSTLDEVQKRYPVLGRTEGITLSIEDTSPFALGLVAIDWEAYYTNRSQRA